MKTVSVIIPAYNEEKRIEKSVGSVCGQTYKDLQIIIINDGSTDATPVLAEQMAEKDGRITVIQKFGGGVFPQLGTADWPSPQEIISAGWTATTGWSRE